jgi:hypothetical protein
MNGSWFDKEDQAKDFMWKSCLGALGSVTVFAIGLYHIAVWLWNAVVELFN